MALSVKLKISGGRKIANATKSWSFFHLLLICFKQKIEQRNFPIKTEK